VRPFALMLGPLLAALGASAGAPPVETLERLEQAMHLLELDGVAGRYTLTTRSVIAKPGGKDPETSEVVVTLSRRAGEPTAQELVRATRNGKDETEELRRKLERAREKADGEEHGEEVSVGLELPGADTLSRYRFGPVENASGAQVATFEPDDPEQAGAVSGRIAWDGSSLDPLWIELEPVEIPRHVQRMSTRIELGRSGDTLWPRRTSLAGQGGILFVKREFRVDMEVSEAALDPP
jgi:hypothetical protein